MDHEDDHGADGRSCWTFMMMSRRRKKFFVAVGPDVDLPNVRLGAILPGRAKELPGCAVEIVVGLAPAAVSKARV